MTQEEKAKRYDEALEELRGLLEGIREEKCKILEEDITSIFPELQDSEDEKIRKDIIEAVELHKDFTQGRKEEIYTWLEKQGEQKQEEQPRYNIGDVICDKSCTTLNKKAQPNMEIVDIKNGMYICDKGSFPVSQQDEYVLVSKKIDMKPVDSVSNELRTASFAHAEREMKNQTFHDNKEFELAYTFEEGAKWNAAQKHNWSEEDEGILDEILDFFENGTVKLQHDLSLYASWLKSLKDRYAYEPSDAQMIALNDVIANGHLSNANKRILKGLQEQLKKLRGE